MDIDVTKPLPGQSDIQAAVDRFQRAIRRPERETPEALRRSSWWLFLLSLLPVLCVLAATQLGPKPDRLSVHPPIPVYADQIETGRGIVADDLQARIAAMETRAEVKATIDLIAELEAIEEKAKADALKTTLDAHQRYRTIMLFVLVLTVFCVGSIIGINAQLSVIKRHWGGAAVFFVDKMKQKPRTLVNGFSALGAIAIGLMMFFIDLPGPLTVSQTATALWSDPTVAPYVVAGCAVLILGLVTSLIFATAFGTFLFARNFPATRDLDDIAAKFEDAARESGLSKTRLVTALWEKANQDADKTNTVSLQDNISTKPEEPPTVYIGSKQFVPLVNQGLSASDSMIVVRRFSTLAAFGMILALITLSLGIDVLELQLSGTPDYIATIKASGDTWLVVLGAGMSAALMVVFGAPTLRLIPIAEAEPKPSKPSSSWHISGLFAGPKVDVTASHPPAKSGDPLWDYVQAEMGADETKFKAILGAAHKGGAVHELADQTFSDQISRAAGLLSPAIVGGLLTLLG